MAVHTGCGDFRDWENDESFAREFERLMEDLKADERLAPEKTARAAEESDGPSS